VKINELLREVDSAVLSAEPNELRGLVVALTTAAARAAARQLEESPRPPARPTSEDRMLTAKQTAAMMGVSTRWVYEHAHGLPFSKRLGADTVRFSERGLRAWIESRKP